MSNYIPTYTKKLNIFHKREAELRHAIRNGFTRELVESAAEKVREAKLAVYKAEYSRNSLRPPTAYKPDEKAREWMDRTVDEIIREYSKR